MDNEIQTVGNGIENMLDVTLPDGTRIMASRLSDKQTVTLHVFPHFNRGVRKIEMLPSVAGASYVFATVEPVRKEVVE